jgi:hypothetical protein
VLNLIKNILNKKPPVRPGVGPEEVRAMAAEAAKRAQKKLEVANLVRYMQLRLV